MRQNVSQMYANVYPKNKIQSKCVWKIPNRVTFTFRPLCTAPKSPLSRLNLAVKREILKRFAALCSLFRDLKRRSGRIANPMQKKGAYNWNL